MLGIIGAMDEEVAKLKEHMTDVAVTTKASMDFYHGKLNGKEVVIVRSGIGKVNAAICTQILVDDYKVSAVINTGIAGSLRSEINIGDIVLSTDALEHDMEATAFGYPVGQIPRMDTLAFEAYQFGKSKLQVMKSERGIIEEKEQQYGDSVILIYRGFCYVFTENNGLKTVYKNDRVRI